MSADTRALLSALATVAEDDLDLQLDILEKLEARIALEPRAANVAAARAGQELPADARRTSWENWTGEVSTRSCTVRYPARVAGLRRVMQRAADEELRVKPVGAGHSSSSVARPDRGQLGLDLQRLRLPSEISTGSTLEVPGRYTLAHPPGLKVGERLVRVRAGIPIRVLNPELDHVGLALSNMGTYDGQHFFGAICTGTHGSGAALPPLADLVVALDLVTLQDGKARLVRIARPGITDVAAFNKAQRQHRMQLIESEEALQAAVVSFGTMGVVFAVTFRAVPRYGLQESLQMSTWEAQRDTLLKKATESPDERWDLVVSAYKDFGRSDDHPCLVTVRRPANTPPYSGSAKYPVRPESPGTIRSLEFVAKLDKLAGQLAFRLYKAIARSTVKNLEKRVELQPPGGFRSISYEALRLGYGDYVKATSSEIHVPIEHTVAAVELIMAEAEKARKRSAGGPFYRHTGPLGVRFVAKSQALLAMQQQDTCSIEVTFAWGTPRCDLAMRWLEKRFEEELGPVARFHWGQVNTLKRADVVRSYPKLPAFEQWRRTLDPQGHFLNAFTRQIDVLG